MARGTANFWDKGSPYEKWIEALGVPVHRGYYIEDLRTVELGRWKERECGAAFVQLAGQEGVTGAYVTEIEPGKTLPAFRMAVDEGAKVFMIARNEDELQKIQDEMRRKNEDTAYAVADVGDLRPVVE